MYAYLYLIANDFFPKDVYKIDITQQNKKQLEKKYNKYYPLFGEKKSNIKIIYSTIIEDKNEIIKKINKIFSSISTNFFIKNNNINLIKKKIDKIIVSTKKDEINKIKIIARFIDLSCYYKKNNIFLLNDLFNLYISNNIKIDFIHFIYLIKKSNINITEIDGKYYINNYILKHYNKNLYDEYIINIKIENKFRSIHFLINNFKKWHKNNFIYLKIPHKSELKNNLIKSTENKYGKIKYNPYSLYSFGWII